tara:strand:- start:139 stop:648 length:510 start_codon:yes stop_codon:yes gene_type:complete
MEENFNRQNLIRDKLFYFFDQNKKKIIISFIFILLTIFSLTFKNISEEKKNVKISENYINAGIYFSSNDIDKSKEIYEKIIRSKNKFYSILALNTVIEKEIFKDKNKILEFFEIVEKINKSKDQQDLIILKKSLYLIKSKDTELGKKLLNDLIISKSKFENLAIEILND